jgi:hypothetical protein
MNRGATGRRIKRKNGEMKLIGTRTAANILLFALGVLAIFHLLVLLGLLPADIVWGGRAGDSSPNIFILELAGLIVTLLFAAVVAAKAGYVEAPISSRAIGIGMWVVFGYFLLNIVGNLSSVSTMERALFTPLSVILALAALRVALT